MELLVTILSLVVPAVVGAFGGKLLSNPGVKKAADIAKEAIELVGAVLGAVEPDEDGKVRIDKTELAGIKKEASDLINKVKGE